MLKKFFRTSAVALFGVATALSTPSAYAQAIDELSPEEQAAFRQYQLYDNIYQQVPFAEVEVGEKDFERSGSPFRSTNPNPTSDDSIGAIYYFSGVTWKYEPSCTASHLGGKWWLTAEHCIRGKGNELGAIVQSDGDFAGIENVYFKESKYDIALIKVGTGISTPQAFSLATTKPRIDSVLTAIGFSGHENTQHDFSSKSQMKVVVGAGMWKNEEDGYEYHDISDGLAVDYPICFGDSGGPFYQGRTIYGVNSGVSGVESKKIKYSCEDRGYFANVNSHISWIQKTMRDKNNTSLGEQIHAFKGGTAVKFQRGCDINKSLRNPAFGSSIPGVSKCYKK